MAVGGRSACIYKQLTRPRIVVLVVTSRIIVLVVTSRIIVLVATSRIKCLC